MEPLALTINDHKESTEVREGRATHTRLKNKSTITHTRPQLELTTQLKEFSTQMELKSLSQRIECVRMESWCLEMIKECLGIFSMRLGASFIAPRQLGAVGGILGRPKLPSVGWRTKQSGAPPDRHCSMSGADLLPNLAQPTVATLVSVGAPDTVRCTPDSPVALSTVGAGHVSPADHAADCCEVDRWLIEQSGASPDSPVNFSRTPLNFSRER